MFGSLSSIMNKSFVKSVPQGDFAEVSAVIRGWETQLQALVSQKRPIKCDIYPFEKIPPQILNSLKQQGYRDLILENDRWQHFLIPNSNPVTFLNDPLPFSGQRV